MLTLYYGGNIITFSKNTHIEAVVTNDDTIVFVGALKTAKNHLKNRTYRKVNLNNCTLMPAFIEAHAHFNDIVYNYLSIDATNFYYIDDLLQAIADFIRRNRLYDGQWVTVRRFDHMRMQNQLFPSLSQLDKVAPNNPIVIQHINNKMAIFNSKAFYVAQLHYNDTSITPCEGYLTKNDYLKLAYSVEAPTEQRILDAVGSAQRQLLSNGVTTATDCVLTQDYLPIMRQIVDKHILQMDVAGYVEYSAYDGYRHTFDNAIDSYYNGFRLAGIGVIIDSELHNQTLRNTDNNANVQSNSGTQLMSNQRLIKIMQTANKYGAQLALQANGEMAVKQALWCYEKLDANIYRRARLRPILAHAHYVERTQLKKTRKLNVSPCFLADEIAKHGDINLHLSGTKFYYNCYPLKSAQDLRINYTLCRDISDINSSPLTCIKNALIRTTNGGIILNPSQRVTAFDALKAVTINSAKALKEDDKKGQLAKGKKADMVILSEDPTMIAERRIDQIKVLQTIKDGQSVYKSKDWLQ